MTAGRRVWKNANRRGIIAGGALAAILVGIFAVSGLGAAFTGLGGPHTTNVPALRCFVSGALTLAMSGPPAGSHAKKVLSLTWYAVNDEDSGFAGYWALDSYTSTVTVWYLSAGTYKGDYWWVHTYNGLFQVPQGALSPGETGTTPNKVWEPAAGYGTMAGGDYGYITKTESFTSATPITANLGTKDYGGTTSDILLGTYSGNVSGSQTGPTTAYSWYLTYFTPADPSYANLIYGLNGNAWGFVYTLNPAFQTNPHGSSASANQWCNFGAGDAGDIVTAA